MKDEKRQQDADQTKTASKRMQDGKDGLGLGDEDQTKTASKKGCKTACQSHTRHLSLIFIHTLSFPRPLLLLIALTA